MREKELQGYSIGVMSPEEVDRAVDWAAREGWNPGLHDAECFRTVDPEGFLAGRLDGMMVASISAVRWDENFGFIGFYIVEPGHRGKGLGLALWDEACARLRTRSLSIGLDGVLERRQDYRKSGFTDACGNIRYRGSPDAHRDLPAGARPASRDDFSSIYEYDRTCFPADRTRFLELWLTRPGTQVAVLDAKDRTDGKRIAGYGVLRPCREGWKAGPLFADDRDSALRLLGRLLSAASPAATPQAGTQAGDTGRGSWYLDIPGTNKAALVLAEGLGLTAVFETARMYSEPAPAIRDERIFGITSFELG